MINIKCSAPDNVKLTALKPFQGDLKKRSDKDIEALADSITNDGLIAPFMIWKNEDKENILLDGHGRLAALTLLASHGDVEILTQDFPCVYVEADSEEDARKALLQITSQYGKITKQGAANFCVTIPNYTAPSIAKFTRVSKVKPTFTTEVKRTCIIKMRVPEDKVTEVKQLLSQVRYIEMM